MSQQFLFFVLFFSIYEMFFSFRIFVNHLFPLEFRNKSIQNASEIVICVVSCGMRQQETLNLLKSAIIFGLGHRLRFFVMTEENLMTGFREKLDDWANIMKNQFTFQVLPLIFPKENGAEWRNLFKPCAAQRLFLPVSVHFFFLFSAIYWLFCLIIFKLTFFNIAGNSYRCRCCSIYGYRHTIHCTSD